MYYLWLGELRGDREREKWRREERGGESKTKESGTHSSLIFLLYFLSTIFKHEG